jgi:hypothetical protein
MSATGRVLTHRLLKLMYEERQLIRAKQTLSKLKYQRCLGQDSARLVACYDGERLQSTYSVEKLCFQGRRKNPRPTTLTTSTRQRTARSGSGSTSCFPKMPCAPATVVGESMAISELCALTCGRDTDIRARIQLSLPPHTTRSPSRRMPETK